MKTIVVATLFWIFLMVLFVIVYYVYHPLENMDNIGIDIGNLIALYYCNLINAIIEKRDFDMYKMDDHSIPGNQMDNHLEKYDFLKNLPATIKYEEVLKPFHDIFVKAGAPMVKQQCRRSYYRIVNKEIILFLKLIQPLMKRLIDTALKKTEEIDWDVVHVDHPVIHFRCADTPFDPNPDYKLRRFSYFREALQQVESRTNKKYSRITILSYTKHGSNEQQQKVCSTLAGYLSDYLQKELGYEVEVVSHSNVEDFAIMFYAPAVISTGGSFSLMSGFFGGAAYVMPQDFGFDEVSEPWLLPGHNIEHGSVDYYDTQAVLAELRK